MYAQEMMGSNQEQMLLDYVNRIQQQQQMQHSNNSSSNPALQQQMEMHHQLQQ